MLLSTALWGLVFVICFGLWYRRRRRLALLSHLAGMKPLPVLGNLNYLTRMWYNRKEIPTISYLQELVSGLAHLFSKEGIHKANIGPYDFIFITSPKLAEVITSNQVELHKGPIYSAVRPYFGDGLVTSNGGEKWKRQRKLLNACFTTKVLNEHYFPVMNQQALKLTDTLNSFISKDYIEITKLLEMFVLDVFMDAGMGVYSKFDELEDQSYQSTLKSILNTWMERPIYPWLSTDFIFNLTNWGKQFKADVHRNLSFVNKIIKEKQEQIKSQPEIRQTQNGTKKAFLDLVIAEQFANKNSFSDQDVLDEVTTFVAAGYDNTSSSISWILYMIGLHPDCQSKVHNELDGIFGDDPNRPITLEDLSKMKYLEAVIKETMRLYPGIPIIARRLQNKMEIDGRVYPKGTDFLIHIWAIQRHPDYFENPEVFNPERTFPDKTFMVFSLGPRNCIGQKFALMEQKIMLSTVLRHLRIESLDHRDKVLYLPRVVGRPDKDIRLKLYPRPAKCPQST